MTAIVGIPAMAGIPTIRKISNTDSAEAERVHPQVRE
jgi:hypothetical protein